MSFMSEPRDLQFVDTNILVYAHDLSAGEKHLRARDLICELWQSGDGCLSIQVLQEFYVTVTRKIALPLDRDTAARIVADLSVWQVHCPGTQDVLDAIQLQDRYQLSFWDAMMVSSAIQLGCRRIWSEDLNAGQAYDSAVVTNPF
jgi:predicted nucleic acid-binding protein